MCVCACARGRTVQVGFLWVFVLILAASISEQNLPLFGHGLGGCLTHCTLPTYISVVIAVIYKHTVTLVSGRVHRDGVTLSGAAADDSQSQDASRRFLAQNFTAHTLCCLVCGLEYTHTHQKKNKYWYTVQTSIAQSPIWKMFA